MHINGMVSRTQRWAGQDNVVLGFGPESHCADVRHWKDKISTQGTRGGWRAEDEERGRQGGRGDGKNGRRVGYVNNFSANHAKIVNVCATDGQDRQLLRSYNST